MPVSKLCLVSKISPLSESKRVSRYALRRKNVAFQYENLLDCPNKCLCLYSVGKYLQQHQNAIERNIKVARRLPEVFNAPSSLFQSRIVRYNFAP